MKLPLVARDDVKDPRRPLERRAPFGDMGGLNTPLVPLKLLDPLGDDNFEDIMAKALTEGLVGCGDVREKTEIWDSKFDETEYRCEDVAALGRWLGAASDALITLSAWTRPETAIDVSARGRETCDAGG